QGGARRRRVPLRRGTGTGIRTREGDGMNIRGRLARYLKLGNGVPAAPDIQGSPVAWAADAARAPVTTKVDHAFRIGTHLVVGGWSSAGAAYRLCVDGSPVQTASFATARPDVARYLGRDDEQLGFVLLALDA